MLKSREYVNKVLVGDCRQILKTFPDKIFQTCICSLRASGFVECADGDFQRFHLFGQFKWTTSGANVSPALCDSSLFAFDFQVPQFNTNISLAVFDSQEWPDRRDCFYCFDIGNLPNMKFFTVFGGRLLHVTTSTKERMKQIDGERFYLFDADPFGIRSLLRVSGNTTRISISFNANRSVRINYASQICKFYSFHISPVQEYML